MRKIGQSLILLTSLVLSSIAMAAPEINTLDKEGIFGSYKQTGIAIRGYDTVAYFTQSKPVKGDEQFQVEWKGASWWFASQEHADLFKADPDAYAPQYGGYCAYGVAQDYLVKIEPDQWKIEDGLLYLNYDRGVQKKWLKDVPGYIDSANDKFLDLLSKD